MFTILIILFWHIAMLTFKMMMVLDEPSADLDCQISWQSTEQLQRHLTKINLFIELLKSGNS